MPAQAATPAEATPGRTARRFHDLTFDADFLTAVRPGGARIRFSRHERALLSALAERPGRLFSRDQLLAAMSAEPEELSDRNVDFVINRLRKKLGDSARAPRFIATQYGEGYTWIAPGAPPRPAGFLVVGPVRGSKAAAHQEQIAAAIERFTGKIAERCAVDQEIAFLPNWSRGETEGPGFRFSVRVDLIANRGVVQGGFALRDEAEGRVIRVVRCEFGDEDPDPALGQVAASLIGAIWRDLALAPAAGQDPGGPPLEIRMQNAAMVLSRSLEKGWSFIGDRLAEEAAANPGDPEVAVMRATHLYARLLLNLDPDSEPERVHMAEREIERLALGALPAVRTDPIFRLAVAKLLFAVAKDHLPLVEALVEETLAGSTAFAAALGQKGAIQAYRGDLGAAIASFDEALAFCEPNSEFQIYLLVKTSMVRLALGDREGAAAVSRRIVEIKPAARGQMALLHLPPGDDPLEPDATRLLAGLSKPAAMRLLSYHHRMFVRHFSRPDHARNLMAGPAARLAARFGPSVLPGAVRGMGLLTSP